jgi:hypothetical protein
MLGWGDGVGDCAAIAGDCDALGAGTGTPVDTVTGTVTEVAKTSDASVALAVERSQSV